MDAAIRVLGTRGPRQLTHRAVDAEAGLPAGSTSNYLRTRAALIGAVVTRLGELDRADWYRLAGAPAPRQVPELARLLAQVVAQATGPDRHRTLARYALFVEAAVNPAVREQLASGRAEILGWASQWLRALGLPEPERDTAMVLDYLDGLILHRLALPEPDLDPAPAIAQLLSAVANPGRPDG